MLKNKSLEDHPLNLSGFFNILIDHYGFENYLELGIDKANTFKDVRCKNKVSVDVVHNEPNAKHLTYCLSTDAFFAEKRWQRDPLHHCRKFDLIFIDADHRDEAATRDIHNSLQHLSENGIIIAHDALPVKHVHTYPNGQGTVYIALARLRAQNPELKVCTLDLLNESTTSEEVGVAVIQPGSQQTYPIDIDAVEEKWEFYCKHKRELMNIIKMKDLEKWLND